MGSEKKFPSPKPETSGPVVIYSNTEAIETSNSHSKPCKGRGHTWKSFVRIMNGQEHRQNCRLVGTVNSGREASCFLFQLHLTESAVCEVRHPSWDMTYGNNGLYTFWHVDICVQYR
jgi:hypothetical protein